MDNAKVGKLIYQLRKENGMTQLQLANLISVSDKAVSKWERGLGCPDVSLLADLSKILGVDLERLLSGELNKNELLGGNMKKLKFYCCPSCSNLITSMTDTNAFCCGKKLEELQPHKANEDEKLNVEIIDNEYFISSNHEMSKDHYITFVALLTGDTIILKKQYPEWGLQVRIPKIAHGRLLWCCNKDGLFYQNI